MYLSSLWGQYFGLLTQNLFVVSPLLQPDVKEKENPLIND
jgi:hypothetical protein